MGVSPAVDRFSLVPKRFRDDASAASLEQPIRGIDRKSRRRNATLARELWRLKLVICLQYSGRVRENRVPFRGSLRFRSTPSQARIISRLRTTGCVEQNWNIGFKHAICG